MLGQSRNPLVSEITLTDANNVDAAVQNRIGTSVTRD